MNTQDDIKENNRQDNRISFSSAIIAAYAPHAAQRGVSPAMLIRLVIERIVKDDLFVAILEE